MLQPDGRYRKARRSITDPGHLHELTFSCYKRLPLLSKDRTRLWFIDSLRKARERWGFELWAYVIMPEHAHVLVFPKDDDYDMSLINKSIKQPVARKAIDHLKANARDWLKRLEVPTSTGKIEYRFWQAGGGYDRNIVEPKTAWFAVGYLHHNPVRRKLVEDPMQWQWSSARWYAGYKDVPIEMDGHPPLA